MNYEKAIAILKNGVNAKTYEEEKQARKVGIEALKKQVPKKPTYNPYKHLYICPNCGKYLITYNSGLECSTCCGQKLDWSDTHLSRNRH